MHIDLTQPDTRCSHGSGEPQKHLRSGHSAVEPEEKLIHITLQMGTTSVIRSQQKRLEIADNRVQPAQIPGFVALVAQFHVVQPPIAVVSVALHRDFGRKKLVYNLLQSLSFHIVHDLHPGKHRCPRFRFGNCHHDLCLVRYSAPFSAVEWTAHIAVVHLNNAGKLVICISLPHSLPNLV